MTTTIADIQRRIEAVTASSQTPFIVFVKAVFEGEEVTDRAVYATVDEALGAFRSDMDNKSIIIFIDDIPDVSEEEEGPEAAIIGYTIQD